MGRGVMAVGVEYHGGLDGIGIGIKNTMVALLVAWIKEVT